MNGGENESILFADLPGYGGLPEDHTPETFWDKYQLDSYDAFLCCFESKLNKDDENFFKRAKDNGKQLIFVRTKSDNLYDPSKTVMNLKKEIKEKLILDIFGKDSTLIFASSKNNEGIDDLLFAITDRLDFKKKEKFYRNAKSYSESFLEYKAKACLKTVIWYSLASAGSGAIPVPALGVTIDIPIMLKMVKEIGKQFGLTEQRLSMIEKEKENNLEKYQSLIKAITGLGKDAVITILAKNVGKEGVKTASKIIPLIGGAAMGFGITYYSGTTTIDDCKVLAREILEIELKE